MNDIIKLSDKSDTISESVKETLTNALEMIGDSDQVIVIMVENKGDEAARKYLHNGLPWSEVLCELILYGKHLLNGDEVV